MSDDENIEIEFIQTTFIYDKLFNSLNGNFSVKNREFVERFELTGDAYRVYCVRVCE